MLKRWAAWPPGIRWLAGIAVVVLAAAIVWALFVPLADWLARHDVGSATGTLHETALDNARGRLLTLGAGLVAGGALVFTALNFNLLRRSSEQTDQWQRRTHELTEQGQVTDRYTKAIEQLGSDKLDVRIGGIYALERIARDSAKDHPAVMEVLTAFIREHSRERWPPSDAGRPEQERLTRPDVQAAVTVVGRRDAKRDVRPIDLIGADLPLATLTGADLTGAFLMGARLTGALLTEGALLTRATLISADLISAVLIGADLSGAWLSGAHLDGATLTDADLTGAHLDGANLDGVFPGGTTFAGVTVGGVRWPEGVSVPEGWMIDGGTGRLKRADGLSEVTAHYLCNRRPSLRACDQPWPYWVRRPRMGGKTMIVPSE